MVKQTNQKLVLFSTGTSKYGIHLSEDLPLTPILLTPAIRTLFKNKPVSLEFKGTTTDHSCGPGSLQDREIIQETL